MPIIQFKNIYKQFGQKVIFVDLNFKIQVGEHVLFQGPSGMGKTSIFNLILGFETVDAGDILFNNQLLTPSIFSDLRQKVAYVPQIIDLGQGIVLDILEELMSFHANNHLSLWKTKLPELLDYFDLGSNILTQNFPMLSGGEKQRLAIIIAILLERKIYLLDEPTSALDTEMKQKVIQYFSARKDTTLLVISHDTAWQQANLRIINLAK